MTPLRLAEALLESNYSYATTDIEVPSEMAEFILEWNQLNIPEDVLHVDEDGGKGREREPHITVKYGLLSKEIPPELYELAKQTPPFPVMLGKVSLFTTNPEFDVVKLDVESPWLHKLNRMISDQVPHEDTYPTYHPHLTLAYVEKGSCEHMVGDDPFKADGVTREFLASGLNYSGPGDSDDPERVKETLLFSKTKHPDAALADTAVRESYAPSEQARAMFARHRQELATLAARMVESWHRQGLTSEQMFRRLHSGRWNCAMEYWHDRRKYPQAFRRLTEQVAAYIERLQEAKFAEAVNELDPFVNCNFPVNSDQVKHFLLSNSRRRSQRTVL